MITATRSVAYVLVGGTLVSVGAVLPWMSFFAGLQSFSGLIGLYGRILFASGVLAVLSGTASLRQPALWLRRATALLGGMQLLFICWLLAGLRSTLQQLGMHAMLLARPGPGLFVALLGALLLCASARSPAELPVRATRQ